MIEYLTDKKKIPYLIIFIIGFAVGTYEYGFLASTIVWGGLIIFSIVIGLLIRYFIKEE